MIKFTELLNESIPISKSIKAWQTLSSSAKEAIERWESFNWKGGPLEHAFQNNTPIAQEILKAFEPVKASLPQRIKLYRGLWHDKTGNYDHSGRVLESWTDQKKVAEHFAGRRNAWFKPMQSPDITDKEIDDAVARYHQRGFVRWKSYRLIRSKSNPDYFNIWDDRIGFVTDGDHKDVRDFFTREQERRREINQSYVDRGKIIEELIDRDAVVWLTHNLSSAEYIVKVNR